MEITYVFACLPVTNRDQAVTWYERLLDRPPTFVPNDIEAVWQLAQTASLYVITDAERAGRGITTLIVDDLDSTLKAIAARGITAGAVQEIEDAGRKSVITDPDGNAISIVEIITSPRQ